MLHGRGYKQLIYSAAIFIFSQLWMMDDNEDIDNDDVNAVDDHRDGDDEE